MNADNSEKLVIADKTVCLSLTLSVLGNARKVDSSAVTVDADKAMLNVSKRLFESQEYNAITGFDRETKAWLKRRCLPSYFRNGIYLVPVAIVQEVEKYLNARAEDRAAIVAEFVDDYPQILQQSAEKLRVLHNEHDYPTQKELAAYFGMKWRYLALDVPNTLKGINAALFEKEQERARKLWEEATEEVRALLRETMAGLVEGMVRRLTPSEDGEKKRITDAGLDAAKDFFATFSVRNVTDDSQLAALVSKAKTLMRGVTAEDLKQDPSLKVRVRKGFEKIEDELGKLVINKPKRAISFGDDV